jgi:hypothetical protein
MLFRETVAVYCENYTEHINALSGQNSEYIYVKAPQSCLHLVLVLGLVRLCDLESNAGGSLSTSRATHAGKVKD